MMMYLFQDVKILHNLLPSSTLFRVNYDKFRHSDFLYAKDVISLLYNHIFDILYDFNKDHFSKWNIKFKILFNLWFPFLPIKSNISEQCVQTVNTYTAILFLLCFINFSLEMTVKTGTVNFFMQQKIKIKNEKIETISELLYSRIRN